MIVGINYPWLHCGHDFGPDPPAWGGPSVQRDWNVVEQDFLQFRALGVEVVRLWVLAGGANVPPGGHVDEVAARIFAERFGAWAEAPRVRGSLLGRRRRDELFDLTRPLPPLDNAFLEDFQALLRCAIRAKVRLIPSLLSFEFFQPAIFRPDGVVERGRAGLVFGAAERPGAFLKAVLDPLLEVSQASSEAIWAWEVVNEPDWVVASGPRQWDPQHGFRFAPRYIPDHAMSAFLERALHTIREKGFRATIGFKEAAPRWLSSRLQAFLTRGAAAGWYVHQCHHYPTMWSDQTLQPHDTLPLQPCLLGEFPTARGGHPSNTRWRDKGLKRSESDPQRYLVERLRHIEASGYPMGLLWGARSTDHRTAWTEQTRSQVARYTGARGAA